MASIHLIEVSNGTGIVHGEWFGDSRRQPVAPPGRKFINAASHGLGPFDRAVWSGSAFVVPSIRDIPYAVWLGRFTKDEEDAIELMAETHPRIRVFELKSQVRGKVNLDGEAIGYLAYLKAQGVGASGVWPDNATADNRINEILADG